MSEQAQPGTVTRRIATLAVLGVAVGAAASLAAILFVDLVTWLNEAVLVSPRARVAFENRPLTLAAATVLAPTAGGLLVGLIVRHLVVERRPLGPADTIYTVQSGTPPPSARSGLGATLAAALSLGCGASVGQYGPMVYLGTLIGGVAARLELPVRNLRAIAIGCGVAAAISTAFNAPIAGLVFAHEVILRHYAMQAFAPITIASATGYVLANVVFERPPLFLVVFDGVAHGYEFALFALEGLLCAGLAVLFMRALLRGAALAARTPLPTPLKPAFAGLVLGLVALWVPDVLGIGRETLRFATIEDAFRPEELALIVAAKLAVTVVCLAYGFAGGVFSPSLLIGILFGALYGTLVNALGLFPISHVVVYAICGMMAVASPVIGAPLTTIIIVFELTRNYDLTVSAMVAVIFSNLVAYRVFGRSLFDAQLARRGFDLSGGRDEAMLGSVRVDSVMRTNFPTARAGERTATVVARLADAGDAECMLLDGDGRYVGVVRLADAIGRPGTSRIEEHRRDDAVVFDERTTIGEAMERLRGFVGDAAAVVSSSDGSLLGVAPESAIIEAYLDRVRALRQEENEAP